jgi:hypothetical protein
LIAFAMNCTRTSGTVFDSRRHTFAAGGGEAVDHFGAWYNSEKANAKVGHGGTAPVHMGVVGAPRSTDQRRGVKECGLRLRPLLSWFASRLSLPT